MSNNQRSSNFAVAGFFFAALISVLLFSGLFSVTAIAQKGERAYLPEVQLTRAASPQASTTLTISQVYGGGGSTTVGSGATYLFDYVEIKNVSAISQSLNGLTLMYGSATGLFASSAGNAFALPNVTISPGQYYLVQLGSAGTQGVALPVAADATTTNLSMSASSGKVALATAAFPQNTCGSAAAPCSAGQLAGLVDWVAYGAAGNGTAGNGEGGTSVNNNTALTNQQGGVRNGAGCTDTDNNNLDFTVPTPPVPRNTASTATSCSTAAGVFISGRVTTADGRGITNAVVTITGNTLAEPRTVITGRRGTYMFDDLEPGATYIVSVRSRRFMFSNPSQVISIVDNVTDADFIADGGTSRGR